MLDNESYYSISNKLKSEGRVNEAFEVMLNNLHLEDVIALKLELSARMVKNKLYGFNIWNNILNITREAVFKFAIVVTNTESDCLRLLNMNHFDYVKYYKLYRIDRYFKKRDYR
jgi:hypothetical protein